MGTLIDDLKHVVHEGTLLAQRPDIMRIRLKEKLQLSVLDFIYNNKKYNHLIFYGGTCLRICFGLNRMSEDIDFETTTQFSKEDFASLIKDYFMKSLQYKPVSVHVPGSGVGRIELRFPVLYELGLSKHVGENLLIKVEVNQIKDTYPTEFKAISTDRFSFVARHYDLPTLMAGKMLACLTRVWQKKGVKVKGRDYYDLLWYMQKGVIPNAARLANSSGCYTIKDSIDKIQEKVMTIKPKDLLSDLENLFENVEFPKRWVNTFKEQFEQLYRRYNTNIF